MRLSQHLGLGLPRCPWFILNRDGMACRACAPSKEPGAVVLRAGICGGGRRPHFNRHKMKRKLHRILVGLSLLVILPGAFLALIVLIEAIGSGFQKSFSGANILALPFLILPSFLGWWGLKLVFKLYGQFSRRIRKDVLLYHGLTLCYCGMWLVSTASHNGGSSFAIFGLQERIIGICLLSAPLLVALFTNPEETNQESQPGPQGTYRSANHDSQFRLPEGVKISAPGPDPSPLKEWIQIHLIGDDRAASARKAARLLNKERAPSPNKARTPAALKPDSRRQRPTDDAMASRNRDLK